MLVSLLSDAHAVKTNSGAEAVEAVHGAQLVHTNDSSSNALKSEVCSRAVRKKRTFRTVAGARCVMLIVSPL